MGGEPEAARRGLDELTAMLIAAHGVVAQLSAARIALRAVDPAEADQARVEAAAARRWLGGGLAAGGAAAGETAIDRDAPFSALKRATRRLDGGGGSLPPRGGGELRRATLSLSHEAVGAPGKRARNPRRRAWPSRRAQLRQRGARAPQCACSVSPRFSGLKRMIATSATATISATSASA